MTSVKSCFDTVPGTARHRAMRVIRFATLCMAAAWFAVIAQPALAATCTIAATPVSFGAYDVFAASANDNGIGTLNISCSGGPGNVTLSTGQGSYAQRVMKSGANQLNYNLYTTAARTTIWGDGITGGTGSMPAAKNVPITLSVYGRIPAGQDATVGAYTDNITATVTF